MVHCVVVEVVLIIVSGQIYEVNQYSEHLILWQPALDRLSK